MWLDPCAALLVAAAAAIGNARRIQLKRGWTEPSIIWACIVAESGQLKSPALDAALRRFVIGKDALIAKWKRELEEHKAEQEEYEHALDDWKRKRMPTKPENLKVRNQSASESLYLMLR